MSKSIIIAAAASAFLFAAPAFAQDAGCPAPGFEGPHGSATNLRDTPSSDPTAGKGSNPGFGGRHGSATNLTDTPREPAPLRRATLSMRKTGGDGATEAQPAAGTGLRKVGAGTLAVQSGSANTCR